MSTSGRTLFAAVALLVASVAPSPMASTLVVPDAPDLRIKTRLTVDSRGSFVSTVTLTLKGARQRREDVSERALLRRDLTRTHSWIRITQCDERRLLLLNPDNKLYAYEPIVDFAEHVRQLTERQRATKAALASPQQQPPQEIDTRPVVTVTIDAVDTGERRTYGSYTAKRIIMTRTTAPGPGARTPANIDEHDGWYLDLPDSNCQDPNGPMFTTGAFLTVITSNGQNDRLEYKQARTTRRGYALEETHRSGPPGPAQNPIVDRIELVEMSEAPLDPALFTVPDGYRPALANVYGVHDLTKPDTLMNRLESYGQAVSDWANRYFNFRPRSY